MLYFTELCVVCVPHNVFMNCIKWTNSHFRLDEDVSVRRCLINRLFFADNLKLLHPLNTAFNMQSSFSAAYDHNAN